MPLNIKDPETDRLVRELARETGEPITVATRVAVQERLERLRRARAPRGADELAGIIARGRSRSTLDHRPEEEILRYADSGLPT